MRWWMESICVFKKDAESKAQWQFKYAGGVLENIGLESEI